ncbi:hypothetical protein F2Q69_00006532 [Brassica cretica]|uniref:Pentatricopeptide repeat-containing protein n=1 Tax=Brassica cretica TaxID=69181 RepID=A0A8S9PHP6_BRACR|nr:hypothetical protein F2Q69_00006532 [Brassica cretica]
MKSSGWSQNHVTFVGVLTAFDLLARAGHLDEAVKLIIEMKLEPDVVVWKTLLYLQVNTSFPLDLCVISSNGSKLLLCWTGLVRHIKQQSKLGSIKRLSASLVSPFNPPVLPFGEFISLTPSKHLFPVGFVRHIKQWIEIASLLDRCVTSGNKLASGISAAFRICCATLQSTISSFVGLVHHIKQQSKLGRIKRLFAPLVSPYNPPVLPFGEFILLSPIE